MVGARQADNRLRCSPGAPLRSVASQAKRGARLPPAAGELDATNVAAAASSAHASPPRPPGGAAVAAAGAVGQAGEEHAAAIAVFAASEASRSASETNGPTAAIGAAQHTHTHTHTHTIGPSHWGVRSQGHEEVKCINTKCIVHVALRPVAEAAP